MAALASLCLAAGSAEARNKAQEEARARQAQAQCEEQCSLAVEEKAQKCMKKCPLPRGGNSDDFQACAQSCIHQATQENCNAQCTPEARKPKSGAKH
jgi:hypothetical protein